MTCILVCFLLYIAWHEPRRRQTSEQIAFLYFMSKGAEIDELAIRVQLAMVRAAMLPHLEIQFHKWIAMTKYYVIVQWSVNFLTASSAAPQAA